MADELLTPKEAAHHLGIAVTSLYAWLGQSDSGLLVIRGKPVTINYLQGGPQGQGRIRIEAGEVTRLKELMRVKPQRIIPRDGPVRQQTYPGITVPLGRPDSQ